MGTREMVLTSSKFDASTTNNDGSPSPTTFVNGSTFASATTMPMDPRTARSTGSNGGLKPTTALTATPTSGFGASTSVSEPPTLCANKSSGSTALVFTSADESTHAMVPDIRTRPG